MHALRFLLLVATATAAGLFGMGCNGSACEEFFPGETCPYDGVGGDGGSTSASVTGASSSEASSSTGIDATCTPSDPAWAPSSLCGVFVREGGTGGGTPDAPFGTVVEALAAQRPIYIAEGTYEGAVSLPSGTVVFGGLKTDWSFDAATRPVLTAPANAIPVRLAAGANTTELHHVKVEARTATDPGTSSIAVIVDEVPSVLDAVDLVAGDGRTGDSSTTPTLGIGPTDPASDEIEGVQGASANITTPDVANPGAPRVQNPYCTTAGGRGGDGGLVDGSAAAAAPGSEGEVLSAGCMGNCGQLGLGQLSMAGACQAGTQGAKGSDGENGIATTLLGTLTTSGYQAPPPDDGTDAAPGQGGGGGGGSMGTTTTPTRGASGGSGGAGGCGGHGAPGGQGGGSSIALVLLGQPAMMTGVTLTIGGGGDGGVGADGQFGVTGGFGGNPGAGLNGTNASCRGGDGGQGGNGGHGAGGRGGHAVGIAYNGTAPTGGFTLTAPGLAGEGGMSNGNLGTIGESAETLDFVP